MARQALRELLIQAGVDLVLEHGLRSGLEAVSFPAVFAEVERTTGRRVSRGSVYERIWSSLESFHWDVLSRVTEHALAPQMAVTAGRLGATLLAIEPSSEEDRWEALTTIGTTVVVPHIADVADREDLRIVRATIPTLPASDADLDQEGRRARVVLGEHVEQEAAWTAALARVAGRHLGLRVRAPHDVGDLALAVGALVDGLGSRHNVSDRFQGPRRAPDALPAAKPTDRDRNPLDGPPAPADPASGGGADETDGTASLTAVAFAALVRSFVELDPDWPGPLRAGDLEAALRDAAPAADPLPAS